MRVDELMYGIIVGIMLEVWMRVEVIYSCSISYARIDIISSKTRHFLSSSNPETVALPNISDMASIT